MDHDFSETSRQTSGKPPQSPSSSGGASNDMGSFECNICLELAQDPIVTLCGHLFCWPCLYNWLHRHAHSQECPVCKAIIEEEKLVPLYGRGKASTDPRSKSIPSLQIPNRPSGQRPATAPPADPNQFSHQPFGFMRGQAPVAATRFGNFTFSAGFGLFPSLFGFQMHGFPDGAGYGAATGFPYGFNTFHGGHVHGFPQPAYRVQSNENKLSMLFIITGLIVLAVLILF